VTTDRPCDCPATTHGPHHISEHEQDCHGLSQTNEACGGCWACIAMQVAYHQVIASRGGAA
jgi:hypothetical protein